MTLPVSVCPRDTVTLAGGEVEIRSMSRAEAVKARLMMPDVEAAEVYSIECATSVSHDEAARWYRDASNDDATKLVDAIYELSGLAEETGKDDAGNSH